MKVLERKEPPSDHLEYKCNCPQCKSTLVVETEDLILTPGYSDAREHWEDSYCARCAVCWKTFTVPTSALTDRIKEIVKDRFNKQYKKL